MLKELMVPTQEEKEIEHENEIEEKTRVENRAALQAELDTSGDSNSEAAMDPVEIRVYHPVEDTSTAKKTKEPL